MHKRTFRIVCMIGLIVYLIVLARLIVFKYPTMIPIILSSGDSSRLYSGDPFQWVATYE